MKKPRKNSVNENSNEFRRNTSPQGHWKNYTKRRQSQTYILIGKVDMLSNTQNSIIINKGKDLKNKKLSLKGMADGWILAQVNKIYRPSG